MSPIVRTSRAVLSAYTIKDSCSKVSCVVRATRERRNHGMVSLLSTYSHADAAYTYVGAQALPYTGAFPEDAHGPVLFPVEDAGEHVVHVGARADQEEDDEEEGLEVEEG